MKTDSADHSNQKYYTPAGAQYNLSVEISDKFGGQITEL